jgi:hypothetical protein
MKLDTSHSHSEEAVNAMNNALTMPHADPIWVLSLLLTEWADDKDLLDIAKFLKERLDTTILVV